MMDTTEAEKEIETILKTLEINTGSVVKEVNIIDVETTSMTSIRKEVLRRVEITMERLPGTNWG